jgi:hypothetical protein
MNRWSKWSRGTERKLSLDGFLKEAAPTDMGNPTGTGAVSPAQRAAQLGLQSDGHGSYVDPATGQVVARTVNGELVFYDNSRASGGAIADGSGGAQLTQAAPSWIDPDNGMIVVPPAKPESEEEIASIPATTPATEPVGFSKFMQKQKDKKAQEKQMQMQVEPQLEEVLIDLLKTTLAEI